MLKFLGPYDYVTAFPRAFLRQLEHARDVRAALSAVREYELVELCMAPEYPTRLVRLRCWLLGRRRILNPLRRRNLAALASAAASSAE